ncbi:MAG TPA: CoA pyrophosphatase, partial [Bacteroidales bacterium]|nr:CoA pyrophosphatase [Bacteroidales bacterium]
MTTLTLNQVDLEQMVSWLMTRLKNSLPGKEAQLLMAPPLRENRMAPPTGFNPIESAVLIALVLNHNEPSIIFIKRPEYDGVHSGQMALPGGKKEKEDSNEWETAIRESYEEIGLPLDSAKQIGQISPLYIP